MSGHLFDVAREHAERLVVIDPENGAEVERLARAYVATWSTNDPPHDETLGIAQRQMQAALREYVNPTPPKPDEPTGLGAVVVAGDGREWIHHGRGRWMRDDGSLLEWTDLTILRVLSEGVTP